MSQPSSSQTWTTQNIVAAYQSAYFSAMNCYPEECKYLGDGRFVIDGTERNRTWVITEIHRLRQEALKKATHHDVSSRGRLMKLIQRFASNNHKKQAIVTCQKCGGANPADALRCEICGAFFAAKGGTSRLQQNTPKPAAMPPPDIFASATPPAPAPPEPTDLFPKQGSLILHFEEEVLQIPMIRKVCFGRDTPRLGITSFVDFRPYSGYRHGISRRHAEINLTADHHLEITDLGSSNGTFLNGQQLVPLHGYRVQHGDTIRLGSLNILVQFYDEQARV